MEKVEIQKLELSENDIVVAHIETVNMPKAKAFEFAEKKKREIEEALKESGLNNKVLVFDKSAEQKSSVEVLTVNKDDKLVFNIATGNMPKAKAEQYIQKLMQSYKNRKSTDLDNNILQELESFWFAVPNDGPKSEVIVEKDND